MMTTFASAPSFSATYAPPIAAASSLEVPTNEVLLSRFASVSTNTTGTDACANAAAAASPSLGAHTIAAMSCPSCSSIMETWPEISLSAPGPITVTVMPKSAAAASQPALT